jgi:hypothetical protein
MDQLWEATFQVDGECRWNFKAGSKKEAEAIALERFRNHAEWSARYPTPPPLLRRHWRCVRCHVLLPGMCTTTLHQTKSEMTRTPARTPRVALSRFVATLSPNLKGRDPAWGRHRFFEHRQHAKEPVQRRPHAQVVPPRRALGHRVEHEPGFRIQHLAQQLAAGAYMLPKQAAPVFQQPQRITPYLAFPAAHNLKMRRTTSASVSLISRTTPASVRLLV